MAAGSADCQRAAHQSRQFSFVEDFFTAQEVRFIQSLDSGAVIQDAVVTLIWSAKEAILKAWQKGLRLDTRHIDILPETSIPFQFDYANPEKWQPLNWRTDLPNVPSCWLGWRRWENFILTLAVTQNDRIEPDHSPQITELKLNHLPF
ncbi:MAG: 4'-phosphopantetheinyl transferase superfamily protein [Anaerolineales bacterium]